MACAEDHNLNFTSDSRLIMLSLLSLSEGLNLTPRMNVRSGEQVLLSKFGLPGAEALDRRQVRAPRPFCPGCHHPLSNPARPIDQALALGLVAATPLLGVPMPAAAEDGMFSVPPLPYAYDAPEPHMDAATMKFHHDFHHQAYVNNANKAMAGKPAASIA